MVYRTAALAAGEGGGGRPGGVRLVAAEEKVRGFGWKSLGGRG